MKTTNKITQKMSNNSILMKNSIFTSNSGTNIEPVKRNTFLVSKSISIMNPI